MRACDEWWESLDAVADGEPESAALREHLAGCEACRGELARLREALGAVAAMPLEDPGPAITKRVLGTLRARTRRVPWARGAALALAGSAGGAVLLVAATMAALWFWLGGERLAAEAGHALNEVIGWGLAAPDAVAALGPVAAACMVGALLSALAAGAGLARLSLRSLRRTVVAQ